MLTVNVGCCLVLEVHAHSNTSTDTNVEIVIRLNIMQKYKQTGEK